VLEACTTEPPALARVFPRAGPLDSQASRMAGGVAQPLAPACGARAVVGMLRDVGDHSGMEHALPRVDRITATIEVHRRIMSQIWVLCL